MSEASGSVCVFGVNGECMVRGVIGGRRVPPKGPRGEYKVELVGIVKFNKWKSFCCWWGSRLDPIRRGAGALLTVGSVAANGEFR